MPKTLYICYFWINEPLVQTQVLPYLREIRNGGIDVSIVTFERETPRDAETIREALAAEGIDWHWLRYHRRLSVLASAWDIFRGSLFIWNFVRRKKPEVLHGRVHMPTLMGVLARKFSFHKPKLLFDIRGFFPEEYVDAGTWPANGVLFNAAKRIEKWLMRESDGFVVLTENARNILFPESKKEGYDKLGRPIEVIPCCVDFVNRFSGDTNELRIKTRERLGITNRYVIVHLGSLGGLYLTEQIVDFMTAARNKDIGTFALFLTKNDKEVVTSMLRKRGFTDSDFLIRNVGPTDVQSYLAASDVAISFVKAGYSTASRSPTKIPEYLASGVPVLANRGVGDVDRQITSNGVGVLLHDFRMEDYVNALEDLEGMKGVGKRCMETARREFDLDTVGKQRYQRIYQRLISSDQS